MVNIHAEELRYLGGAEVRFTCISLLITHYITFKQVQILIINKLNYTLKVLIFINF